MVMPLTFGLGIGAWKSSPRRLNSRAFAGANAAAAAAVS
jgi:hypothetical protein